MYFEKKFYRLPLQFDAQRLRSEIEAVDETNWSPHPQAFKGNDALILLSSGGTINDLNYGPMEFTPCMEQLPYLKQVLESFNTVIGRTRLMRLAPGEKVGRHSDVSLYWWHRFRIHVPIVTHPDVKFFCEDTYVHMQAGEAWTFDNWRYHEVHNNSDITRVHLVIDTVGSPAIWNMLEEQSWHPEPGETLTPENFQATFIPYKEAYQASFPTEKFNIVGVLSPAELDAIADFLFRDLNQDEQTPENIIVIQSILTHIKRAWRALYSEKGNQTMAYPEYESILTENCNKLNSISPQATLNSNGFFLASVLRTQVFLTMKDTLDGLKKNELAARAQDSNQKNTLSEASSHLQPVFIVSSPWSGAGLLEILLGQNRACQILSKQQKYSIQKETDTEQKLRQIIQIFRTLNPSRQIVYSAHHLAVDLDQVIKTFPEARFIFLFDEPVKVIKRMTYDLLSNNAQNWHYLLSPERQSESLSTPGEKAYFQYRDTNQEIHQFLKTLPNHRVLGMHFEQIRKQTIPNLEKICAFCQIPFGSKMKQVTESSLSIPTPDIDTRLNQQQQQTASELYQLLLNHYNH